MLINNKLKLISRINKIVKIQNKRKQKNNNLNQKKEIKNRVKKKRLINIQLMINNTKINLKQKRIM